MKVELTPPSWATELLSDMTDMDRDPLELNVQEPVVYELPDDAYFEYAYRDREGRMLADPKNELRAENPWYPEVSALFGPAYRPHPLANLEDATPQGTTERLRLESEALAGQTRRATIYTPAGHEGRELPLVIVQDGVAFYRLGRLHLVADALIGRGETRPARFALVEPRDRESEYGFSDAYRDFLTEELLPHLEAEYPSTGERVWMGASLGGLLSATMAALHPELVDSLATFSGAFLGTPENREFYATDESWVLDRFRNAAQPPARWYLEVGSFEWLEGVNRGLAEALAARGAEHEFEVRNAGHNWTSWRNGLAGALRYVLAP